MFKGKAHFLELILVCFLLGGICYDVTVADTTKVGYAKQLKKMEAEGAVKKKRLIDEYESKIYLASGSNVYDRAYNQANQTIIEMIKRLSNEAVPDGWKCQVKVEEFTNFILLLQPPSGENLPSVSEVAKYITPILKYSAPYLENVAVFTKNRKAYLYFNKVIASKLINGQNFNDADVALIARTGSEFTRYNSIQIEYELHNGHMIIPVSIMGKDGVSEEKMLIDTGASMTLIPLEAAFRSDQGEDLNKVSWQKFQTANGPIKCPITTKTLVVGDIEKKQTVAVFPEKQQMGLLGVDFFVGKEYTVDSSSKSIYVWET